MECRSDDYHLTSTFHLLQPAEAQTGCPATVSEHSMPKTAAEQQKMPVMTAKTMAPVSASQDTSALLVKFVRKTTLLLLLKKREGGGAVVLLTVVTYFLGKSAACLPTATRFFVDPLGARGTCECKTGYTGIACEESRVSFFFF